MRLMVQMSEHRKVVCQASGGEGIMNNNVDEHLDPA